MKNSFVLLYILLTLISTNLKSQNSNIELSGDILEIVVPVSALASTFVYKDNYKGTIQFIKSFGLSMIVTHSLKRIINKKRPNGGDYSFPSGHTTSAFAGAAFIEKKYGWKIGIPAYLAATYVGWSRIHAEKHDIYDVLAGASVGIISAYLFTKPYKNTNLNLSATKSQLQIKINYMF